MTITQPTIPGGTLSPEGALTSGAAPEVDPLSISTIPAATTASTVWWKHTPADDVVVNFDAMLSYTATELRTALTPDITVSVYHPSDLGTPIATSSSGTDPQQGAVARGSVTVSLDTGVAYRIALSGGPDAYRLLRVSAYAVTTGWLTIDSDEFVQVIVPPDMTITAENFTGDYAGIVGRTHKSISYGLTPPFAGPAAYGFPAAWQCAWQGHLNPCYSAVDGQLWNNPPSAIEWTGSGICKVTTPPGPHTVGADAVGPLIGWANDTDSSGHAVGSHVGTGYRIDNDALLADAPGPESLGDLPVPPPGAVLEWEDDADTALLTLEIAATDDGTGDGVDAFRRFSGGYGADAAGTWWMGEKPSGELLITGYNGGVSWQPFTLEEGDTSKVVGIAQYVEDDGVPPAPSIASSHLGEDRSPELAFRLTWEPSRYRFVYPTVVPSLAGFVPVRKTPRKDGYGYESAARVLAELPAERHIGGSWD